MTVSKTILEKAKEFKKWNEWDTSTSAEFAESILQEAAADLQKENARLEKALRELLNVAEKYGIFTNHIESAEIATSLALSGARSALNPPKSGAVQKGLSDKETP